MVTHIHGIPIKEKIITIVLKNGIKQPIAVRNLETAKKQLKEIQTLCPWISIGLFPRRK